MIREIDNNIEAFAAASFNDYLSPGDRLYAVVSEDKLRINFYDAKDKLVGYAKPDGHNFLMPLLEHFSYANLTMNAEYNYDEYHGHTHVIYVHLWINLITDEDINWMRRKYPETHRPTLGTQQQTEP